MADQKVRVFTIDRKAGAQVTASAPIQRQALATSPDTWVGVAHTHAGLASEWHHHSDNDTYGYMISGSMRIEFGPGGKEAAEVGSNDAFHVPKRIIHREVTAESEPGVIFLVRVGSGEPVVNVDGPEGS
ncbi:MAG TPA: cupin domain-containing protein [Candidatus Eisenbacteria bacterium]|nr:cupin domain-containing protein [Candidatus Eisenbacteria bacterium]